MATNYYLKKSVDDEAGTITDSLDEIVIGQFNGTATGPFASGVSVTLDYMIYAGMVHLFLNKFSGTQTSANTITIDSLPAILDGPVFVEAKGNGTDNGNDIFSNFRLSGGQLLIGEDTSFSNFSGTGTLTIYSKQFIYPQA